MTKVHPDDIKFSINEYDRDGDIVEEGVFLHFGRCRVKAAENIEDFYTIVDTLNRIVTEIKQG
jgi:hypothetical protein